METKEQNPKTIVVALPEDLVQEEILQYLPVNSLVRFKSVSKQWRSMIESSYFAKKHRVCSFSKPKLVVVGQKTMSQDHKKSTITFLLETFATRDDHRGENDTQISRFTCSYTFQDPISKHAHLTLIKVVGSCDGLVCIQDSRYLKSRSSLATNVYIINPATRKQLKLYSVQLQDGLDVISGLPVYMGFGKDMVTETYKTIFLDLSKSLDDHSLLLKTTVLTLDNGNGNSEQRDIGLFPISHVEISDEQSSVFANGSVFWSTQPSFMSDSLTPIELVALDLHTEKFRRVSWPSWYVQHCRHMRLWSLKDRLCLSNIQQSPNLDVWSLKKMEDSSEQWENIFAINVSSIGRLDTKFWMLGLQAAYVRPKEEIDIDKIPLSRWRTTLYRETLVSPYASI